jgi:putative heme-binding domain-containing protein
MLLKTRFTAMLCLLLPAVAGAEELFNGKDLTGWDGDPRLWRVEDGVLIGETDKADRAVTKNTFLIWKGGEPGDFELTYKARVTGNNSGVQYRSRKLADEGWRIGGYQMDLHPKQEYAGMLYEEGGRGIQCLRGQKVELPEAGGKPKVTEKLPLDEVDLAQWNEYRILAHGNVVQHYVNGKLAAEITDLHPDKRALKGLLALQLHAGPPMKAEFKDIVLNPVKATKPNAPEGVQVKEGFQLEKLYPVPKDQGSWVSMTVDDQGRLICGDQYGGLYRVTLGDTPAVEPLPLKTGGAHGLLWHRGVLYVGVNEQAGGASGVYRVTDADGDGELEKIDLIKPLQGRGEHGPHSLVPSPDGEWVYFVAGNHTNPPEHDRSWVPEVWQEDQLIPSRPDARGHARGRMAPGGWIARFRPDGSNWELVSIGYRNAYDIAFSADGTLFTYDADMEWDLGMPWYRPTRICQALPGSEFGWRNGTAKWPAYYEDSMPPVHDIGPGSPTALISGKGARFPAKFQRRLYAFDWTFGTIHAFDLTPDGAGYKVTTEEFISGEGMPYTAAAIGKDGNMYFLTGGRRIQSALWKVSYTGSESTAPVSTPPAPVVKNPSLASADRIERYIARTAMELQGPEAFAKAGTDPHSVIQRAIGLARLDGRKFKPELVASLCRLDWSALDTQQRISWLRAAGLAFIRGGEPTAEERKAVLGVIDAAYPATDDPLNAELCRMLCYLKAPGVVGRTLALMDSAGPEPKPDWAELASRNKGYGKTILMLLKNQPPARVIHYAYCLRTVPGPWTPDERTRYFGWMQRLASNSGGASYGGFLKGIREDAANNAAPEEKEMIAKLPSAPTPNPLANLPSAAGPGRAWTVDDVVATVGSGKGDAAHGAVMFKAGMCVACHRFGSEGGAVGPDLTAVAGRFDVRALAEAILDPSKEISDQYVFDLFTREDGSQVIGREIDEKDEKLIVAVNPFDFSQTVEVARAELVKRRHSPVSPMPAGLVNSMNPQELRDLFAYLLGK